jgi:hypothetical protein
MQTLTYFFIFHFSSGQEREKKMSSSRRTTMEECDDGLTQKTTNLITYVGDVHAPTTITITAKLPPCLTATYWDRHKLTINDVSTLTNSLCSLVVWTACLLEGNDVASGSVKSSFDTCEGLLVSGKTTALKKLMKLRKTINYTNDVIDASDVHLPPLPRHFVGEDELKTISTIIAPKLNCLEPIEVPGIFNFVGKTWLPLLAEGSAIVLHRLSPIENFHIKENTPKLYWPMLCVYNKQIYGLCHEVIRVFA